MVIDQSGGATGIRDLGLLDSALAQPRATFVQNHPFVDGNKRVGHAAMATFLILNGLDLAATMEEQEGLILDLASGRCRREELAVWLREHTKKLGSDSAV